LLFASLTVFRPQKTLSVCLSVVPKIEIGIFVERESWPKGILAKAYFDLFGVRKRGNNDASHGFCCIFVNIKPIVAVENDLESL